MRKTGIYVDELKKCVIFLSFKHYFLRILSENNMHNNKSQETIDINIFLEETIKEKTL